MMGTDCSFSVGTTGVRATETGRARPPDVCRGARLSVAGDQGGRPPGLAVRIDRALSHQLSLRGGGRRWRVGLCARVPGAADRPPRDDV